MSKTVRKIIVCVIMSALCAGAVTLLYSLNSMQKAFDCELYENVLRLHVLSNSDNEADVELKLKVRDAVLEYATPLLENAHNIKEAQGIISENLCDIRFVAEKALRENNSGLDAKVLYSDEFYPVRYYDGFAFPSGKYNSLRIVLGQGNGKNWWCVLYPSVCSQICSDTKKCFENAGISSNVSDIICKPSQKTKFKLYLLELFNK